MDSNRFGISCNGVSVNLRLCSRTFWGRGLVRRRYMGADGEFHLVPGHRREALSRNRLGGVAWITARQVFELFHTGDGVHQPFDVTSIGVFADLYEKVIMQQ